MYIESVWLRLHLKTTCLRVVPQLAVILSLQISTWAAPPSNPVTRNSSCQIETESVLGTKITEAVRLRDQEKNESALKLLLEVKNLMPSSCDLLPHVMSQLAVLYGKLGFYAQAGQFGQNALAVNDRMQSLNLREQSVDLYLVATAWNTAGQYQRAEAVYETLMTLLKRQPLENRAVSISQVYGDLAMMSLRQNKLDTAEVFVNQASAAARAEKIDNPDQEALRADTLIHIKFARGRLSESMADTMKLLQTYASSKTADPSVSAHLNSDYGEYCAEAGKYDKSYDHLQKSIEIRTASDDTSELATTYASLAKVEYLRHRLDSAETFYREALRRITPFANSRPMDAAAISASFGEFLSICKRWTEARGFLVQALHLSQVSSANNFRANTLTYLAEVYHHLKDKKDEKESRREAKALMAGVDPNQAPSQTVDLATLEHAYSRN